MKNEEEGFIPLDAENEAVFRHKYVRRSCHRSASSSGRSAYVFDVQKDADVICIGSKVLDTSNSSTYSDIERSTPKKKKVTFVIDEKDDEVEWIIPAKKNEQTVDVFDVDDDDEIDDSNYSLRIEPCDESNIIDVEPAYISESNCRSNLASKDSVGGSCTGWAKNITNTVTVTAEVHRAPVPSSCSPISSHHDDSILVSEIDDYDARMRACFALDLDVSTSTETTASELNRSVDSTNVSTSESENVRRLSNEHNVIEVEDDSDVDDCILTSMEISASSDTKSFSSCMATPDVKLCKKKLIAETTDEIFKRMMPSAVPGALSLFAADRHCLPRNVRPSKFCYYYFVSSHVVVKEIAKQEFYKLKEQIMVTRKSNTPTKCNCLTHPLNQNASKLTLLTNPYSLFHKPSCHFARNSKSGTTKRKGPRRLSYQVSLHRVPQQREGKDFKDWSDIVIRRKQRQRASCDRVSSSSNWSSDEKDEEKSISYKSEPIDSDSHETITIKAAS